MKNMLPGSLVLACAIANLASAQGLPSFPFPEATARIPLGRPPNPRTLIGLNNQSAAAAALAPMVPPMVLRSGGSIISGSTTPISLDVGGDYNGPVFLSGTVYTVDAQGNLSPGKSIFAGKGLSLTKYGPGFFPALYVGGVLPFNEVALGNLGDHIVVRVALYDAAGGASLIKILTTELWSQVRPTNLSNVSVPLAVNSGKVSPDGSTIVLTGTFPRGVPLTVEVGDPELDSGFASAVSSDGVTVHFQTPAGRTANGLLFPRGISTEVLWTVVVATPDSNATFPRIMTVVGQAGNSGLVQLN